MSTTRFWLRSSLATGRVIGLIFVASSSGRACRRRATVEGLYYVPAILKFLDRREGLVAFDEDYPEDGPDNFGPR